MEEGSKNGPVEKVWQAPPTTSVLQKQASECEILYVNAKELAGYSQETSIVCDLHEVYSVLRIV